MLRALKFLEGVLLKGEPDDSIAFKELYERYLGYCRNENAKDVASKMEFKAILLNEGIRVENSSRHDNSVRVFGVRYRS